MATDTSGDESASFEEIAEKMGSPQRSILSLLKEGESGDGQSLNSQEIRRTTGVSPGSIRHHLKRLESEWGLIEEVGREATGAGVRRPKCSVSLIVVAGILALLQWKMSLLSGRSMRRHSVSIEWKRGSSVRGRGCRTE